MSLNPTTARPAPPDQAPVHADEKTVFVLGNGPSLAETDLTALSGYATIGLNAAYRHWRTIDWRPRYYACLDLVVGLSHKDAIAELIEEGRIERFLLRSNLIDALGDTGEDPRVINFDKARASAPLLAIDPVTTGSHAALWGAELGYDQIVLLGVDANYKEVVEGAARREGTELEIVRDGANPNYYFDGYQETGDRFNLPNPRPDLHVNAWRRVAGVLEMADVRIYNGNENSAVRCFPFVSLLSFLSGGDAARPAEETPERFSSLAKAATSRSDRFAAFVGAYGAKCGIAVFFAAIAFAAWFFFLKPQAALAIFAGACLLALLGVGAGLLYTRYTTLEHLHNQREEIGMLRARLALLEQLLSRASRNR